MKSIKSVFFITLVFLCYTNRIEAQIAKNSELFKTLKQNDSLLFNEGFNKCDVNQFETFIASDFEFYHDKHGITNSKEAFMLSISNGLCNKSNTIKSRRELVKGSLSVYPLYNKGVLYGAIQKGEHKFFEKQDNKIERKTSIAKFTHLWIKKESQWQIKRVLSFNHKMQK
ncbi:DUF4440 domain-containing protein [uncultured Lacinutrix sp.]|uniref:DUF4440 domain-containing protein n=1 Tax=uncultured Lacinutrix sp. TaxID=574032 RepID=UPI0026213DBB|nr:DUF4440 domain-containing protein [uncultured Lacinutrix sp.]